MMRRGRGAIIFPHAQVFMFFGLERLHETNAVLLSQHGESNQRFSALQCSPILPQPRRHRRPSPKIRSPDNHLRQTLKKISELNKTRTCKKFLQVQIKGKQGGRFFFLHGVTIFWSAVAEGATATGDTALNDVRTMAVVNRSKRCRRFALSREALPPHSMMA